MTKNAALLLAITLILFGLSTLGVNIPFMNYILGALAIAAGILILIKK